jgi:hypothetical protein
MNAPPHPKSIVWRGRETAFVVGLTAVIVVLTWGEGWAYIDPNAGGAIAQILAPLAAIVVSFLFYCRREIGKLVQRLRARLKRADSASEARESSPSPDPQ